MTVSTVAKCAGRAKALVCVGSWPAGVRSAATAASNVAALVTGVLLRLLPQVPVTVVCSVEAMPPTPNRRASADAARQH
jgi:hypothetical protein